MKVAHTDVLLLLSEQLLDLVTNVTLWDLDVVLLVTRVGEEVQETVVGNVDLRNVQRFLSIESYT